MWDPADRAWLKGQLNDKLKAIFGTSWDDLFGEGKDCPPFVSFMRNTENPPYEPVTDAAALKVCFLPSQHTDNADQHCAFMGLLFPSAGAQLIKSRSLYRPNQMQITASVCQLGRQFHKSCPKRDPSWSVSSAQHAYSC